MSHVYTTGPSTASDYGERDDECPTLVCKSESTSVLRCHYLGCQQSEAILVPFLSSSPVSLLRNPENGHMPPICRRLPACRPPILSVREIEVRIEPAKREVGRRCLLMPASFLAVHGSSYT